MVLRRGAEELQLICMQLVSPLNLLQTNTSKCSCNGIMLSFLPAENDGMPIYSIVIGKFLDVSQIL